MVYVRSWPQCGGGKWVSKLHSGISTEILSIFFKAFHYLATSWGLAILLVLLLLPRRLLTDRSVDSSGGKQASLFLNAAEAPMPRVIRDVHNPSWIEPRLKSVCMQILKTWMLHPQRNPKVYISTLAVAAIARRKTPVRRRAWAYFPMAHWLTDWLTEVEIYLRMGKCQTAKYAATSLHNGNV